MAEVAALLERRPAILALRTALPRTVARLHVARSPAHLASLLSRHFLDLIIVGPEAARGPALDALRRDYPALPLILYAPVRSDDADLLLRMHRARIAGVAVEGLDEPVLARLIGRHGLAARRRSELLPLASALNLTDALQRAAWALIVSDAPLGLDTAEVARRLNVRRETISRRFASGSAPSLKHAIDAVRLFAAGQLLANPAYRVADAARLLGFSSVSLLQQTSRRTLGVSARQIASIGSSEIAERLMEQGGARGWA